MHLVKEAVDEQRLDIHEFYKANLVKLRQIAIIFKNLVYQ
jgi:hypothetical protein